MLLILFFPLAYSFAESPFKFPVVSSRAYITIDEIGIVEYHTENKEYHFVKAVAVDPFSMLLILEERKESQHLGDEITKSNIKLTAWIIKENNNYKKLWVINHQGNKWEIIGNDIVITTKGCCDSPDSQYHFDIKTGDKK